MRCHVLMEWGREAKEPEALGEEIIAKTKVEAPNNNTAGSTKAYWARGTVLAQLKIADSWTQALNACSQRSMPYRFVWPN